MIVEWVMGPGLGQLITLLTVIIGGVVLVRRMEWKIDGLDERMDKVDVEMSKIVDVLVSLARQDERIRALEKWKDSQQ